MKPYRTIPINECGEALVSISRENFVFFDPPPYLALGAPYNGESPWMLRSGVLEALHEAQQSLASHKPGWKIMLFDAYRPNAVQKFMVAREFRLIAEAEGLNPHNANPEQQAMVSAKVFRIWGMPSEDPATPPPHSTGSAVDITLADETGTEVDMGSPIDENSDRSNPDYFTNAVDEQGSKAHKNRELLNDLMTASGFIRHHAEWWHFSLGDQYWAWRQHEANPTSAATARYGRADLVK